MKEDERYKNMMQEEQDLLLTEHAEARGVKKSGTRLSNAAAARDVTAFARRLEKEVSHCVSF